MRMSKEFLAFQIFNPLGAGGSLYGITGKRKRPAHSAGLSIRNYMYSPVEICHETVINTALQGEPSAPDKFSGAALNK